MDVYEFIRKVLYSNPWLSGMADFEEGDPFAIEENFEMFKNVTKVRSMKKLYEFLRSYGGVFIYKDLYFFSHPAYGVFVYRYPNYKDFVEHLSMDFIEFDKFKKIVRSL